MKNENKLKLRIGNDFTDRKTEQVSCCSHVSFLSIFPSSFPAPRFPVDKTTKNWHQFLQQLLCDEEELTFIKTKRN